MRHTSPTLTIALALLATVAMSSWTAGDAEALQSCSKDADCKIATDACHAGTCIPKAKLCTSTSACGSHEVCDMTCPHGSSGTSTTVVEPPKPGEKKDGDGGTDNDAPDAGSGSAGAKSGSADSDSSAGSDSAGSGGAGSGSSSGGGGSGAAAQPGETTTSTTNTCPKTVGVCVAAPAKVKPDAQCKAFCAVATKCDGLGGSSSGGSSTGSATTPTPGTDAGSSGGSSGSSDGATPTDPDGTKAAPPKGEGDKDSGSGGGGSGGGGSSGGGGGDDGGEDDDEDVPGPKGGEAEGTDPKGKEVTPNEKDTAACEFMCGIIKIEKIAEKEFQAAVKCTIAAASKTCSDVEKDCAAEFKAAEKAMEEEDDKLELALAGGWGGADSASLSGGGGTKNAEETTNTGGQGGDGAAADDGGAQATGTAAAAGGCTAGLTGGSRGASGAAMALLALLALAWRRRLAGGAATL